MSPRESLQTLYSAAGDAPLTRRRHIEVEQAAANLNQLLNEIDARTKALIEEEKKAKQEAPAK